jgi:hypothetical protein
MNPLEQHTAIALALGYTYEDRVMLYDGAEIKVRLWRTPNGGGVERSRPPNYPKDLNAMHDAWLKLSPSEKERFESELYSTVIGEAEFNRNDNAGWITNATAEQRAEAFLRTLDLWKP